VATVNEGGKYYFPTLPPQLRNRFWYENGTLNFKGEFVEPVSGESYSLLNVITFREQQILFALSTDTLFRNAVNALYAFNTWQILPNAVGAESKALTAGFAKGMGFVTLAFGNSTNINPNTPISLEIIQVTCPLYQGSLVAIQSANPFDEKITIRHSGDFGGEPDQYVFEWRTLPPDPNTGQAQTNYPPSMWSVFNASPIDGKGAVDITIQGAGLQTLSDNYFICRYRPMDVNNPCGTNWSQWTDPALAEGWIKRVLSGINPFEQKIQSYKNHSVNTIVSMISQAGARWVGNVPLNQQAADSFGLIEIYETILKRGIGLSIEGTPAVDYPPANDALLLAAGRIADLYMLLGNEAFADAADPTIAFGTEDGTYGVMMPCSQASRHHQSITASCGISPTTSTAASSPTLSTIMSRIRTATPKVPSMKPTPKLFTRKVTETRGGITSPPSKIIITSCAARISHGCLAPKPSSSVARKFPSTTSTNENSPTPPPRVPRPAPRS
jgi:hypothetical protein